MNLRTEIRRAGLMGLNRTEIRNKVGRPSMRQVGLYHRRNLLGLKFRNLAVRRYGYRPRFGMPGSGVPFRGSSTQRKLKKFGHTRPLEHTGVSKQRTLSDKRVNSISRSVNQYRAELPINAPAFNIRPRYHPQINMRLEIEAVAPLEVPELEREWVRQWGIFLGRVGNQNTETLAAA